jgi:hypothetical protein
VALQADPLYTQLLTLPQGILDNPANCVTTKFMRAALNKDPRPVFCVCVSFILKLTTVIYHELSKFVCFSGHRTEGVSLRVHLVESLLCGMD